MCDYVSRTAEGKPHKLGAESCMAGKVIREIGMQQIQLDAVYDSFSSVAAKSECHF